MQDKNNVPSHSQLLQTQEFLQRALGISVFFQVLSVSKLWHVTIVTAQQSTTFNPIVLLFFQT